MADKKIEMAQEIVDDFLNNGKKVVSIRVLEEGVQVILVYEDGSEQLVVGYLASLIKKAGSEQ